jgi:hypothetical protein
MSVLLHRLSASRAALASLAVVAAVLLPAPAALASPAAVIRDCQDGSINGDYSARDYSQALRDIPTDVDEYTDCRDVIRRAQLGAAGGTGAGGGGAGGGAGAGAGGGAGAGAGGSGAGTGAGGAGAGAGGRTPSVERVLADASPEDRAAVREAIASAGGSAPVEVAGEAVDTSKIAQGVSASSSSLPTPVLVALVLLGLTALAGSARVLATRVLGRRPAL